MAAVCVPLMRIRRCGGDLSDQSLNWDPRPKAQQVAEAYLELLSQLKNPNRQIQGGDFIEMWAPGYKIHVHRQAGGKLVAMPSWKPGPLVPHTSALHPGGKAEARAS